jgi:hypothetical protein
MRGIEVWRIPSGRWMSWRLELVTKWGVVYACTYRIPSWRWIDLLHLAVVRRDVYCLMITVLNKYQQ